jgi:hypothetical protein
MNEAAGAADAARGDAQNDFHLHGGRLYDATHDWDSLLLIWYFLHNLTAFAAKHQRPPSYLVIENPRTPPSLRRDLARRGFPMNANGYSTTENKTRTPRTIIITTSINESTDWQDL